MDKVRAQAVLNEIKRLAANIGKIDTESTITDSRFYMAKFPLLVNRGKDGIEERVPFRIYPKMNRHLTYVIEDLIEATKRIGQVEVNVGDKYDTNKDTPYDSLSVGIYINADYIDNAIKLGDETARDVLYNDTIYKLASTGMINRARDYAMDVFISLYNSSSRLRMCFDEIKHIDNREWNNDNTMWTRLHGGIKQTDTEASVYMTVILSLMYSYYIMNEEYLCGYISTNFNYIQKYNSFMTTMNFFMNKINKSELLQFTRDLMEIDDNVFFSVLNSFMNKNNTVSEKKIDLRYGANILGFMGNVKEGYYVTDYKNRGRVKSENLITEGKKCIAEANMIDFKTSPVLIASALTFEREHSIKFFSEFLNISVTRTQAEKITEFSRKIDQVRLLYESMTNQWHKSDAIDAAYAVLKDIDDEYANTTDKDYMIALDDLRKQLMDEILRGRNMDIQKRRMTIAINYPSGYKA